MDILNEIRAFEKSFSPINLKWYGMYLKSMYPNKSYEIDKAIKKWETIFKKES